VDLAGAGAATDAGVDGACAASNPEENIRIELRRRATVTELLVLNLVFLISFSFLRADLRFRLSLETVGTALIKELVW